MNAPEAERALAGLARMGGPALVRDVIELYRKHGPNRLKELRAALAAGDAAETARVAHAFRSSSAQIGATRIASLCASVELSAEAGEMVQAGTAATTLDAELEAFLSSLPSVAADGRSTRRRVIGVVEDNEDARLIVRRILEPEFEVNECATGLEALERFPVDPPDAVLLDLSLPGLDGIEVLARLRAEPALARIPVVALTAHAMAGDREALLARGFDGYATKPILDDEELRATLRRTMAGPA